MFYTLVFAVAVSFSMNANAGGVALDYQGRNFVDDCVSRSIKPPSPLSIKEIMDAIHEVDVEVIDLSRNNFTAEGGCDVLEKANQLPKLRILDLSFNRIGEHDIEFDGFVEKLQALLAKPTFEEVRLGGNYLSERILSILNERYLEEPDLYQPTIDRYLSKINFEVNS